MLHACGSAAGVVTTADTVQQRIRQGPAQVQTVLLNLQKRLDEQRLMSALKVCAGTACSGTAELNSVSTKQPA